MSSQALSTVPLASKAPSSRRSAAIPDHAKAIIRAVAAEADMSVAQLLAPNRVIRLSWPRMIAMHRLVQEKKPDGSRRYSLPRIGRFFGKDHTTVIHACQRVESGAIVLKPRTAEAIRHARWVAL